ncbi:protein tyrosine kinase, partial [Ostertagia ostertagi]
VDNDPTKIRREIILSVAIDVDKKDTDKSPEPVSAPQQRKRGKLKNVIVRRRRNKYLVETNRLFDTLRELMEHYQKTCGKLNKFTFALTNPIKLQPWEFQHSDVKQGNLLGQGAFGEVRAGTLTLKTGEVVDVAIKVLSVTMASLHDALSVSREDVLVLLQTKGSSDLCKAKIKEMMKEARLMRNFKHKNIVRIYGVAVDEQPLYIILELVTGGALNSWLKANAGRVEVPDKTTMCLGAAQGTEYLHYNRCMHRDLAARNCLITQDKVVSSNAFCKCYLRRCLLRSCRSRFINALSSSTPFQVKISDFGLSRMGTHYQIRTAMRLPIKWLAPETITTFSFSLKTDVFSFGVVVYEIFSDGAEPWEGKTNAEVKVHITNGEFLTLPDCVPETLRTFIDERVFVKDPAERADMTEV